MTIKILLRTPGDNQVLKEVDGSEEIYWNHSTSGARERVSLYQWVTRYLEQHPDASLLIQENSK